MFLTKGPTITIKLHKFTESTIPNLGQNSIVGTVTCNRLDGLVIR